MKSWVPILYLLVWAASCSSPAEHVFRRDPVMRPGKTTWEALRDDVSARPSGSWKEIFEAGVARSAAIRAARSNYRAALEAVSAAGVPPAPVISYTYLPMPIETRVGPNEHRVALTQKIPSPFSLVSEVESARAAAEAQRAALDQAVLDTRLAIKSRAAEVHYFQKAMAILSETLQIAEALSSLGARRLGEGASSMYDVARARSQLEQLRYDRVRFAELLREAIGGLNAALDREPQAGLPALPAWQLSSTSLQTDALYERALRSSHRLRQIDHRIRAQMSRVSQAEGRWFPDLVFGVQYVANGPSAMPMVDSGQDALGITLGLSLPFWVTAGGATVRRQTAILDAMVADKRTQVVRLLADVDSAHVALRSARRLIRLYDHTLLPQARGALGDAVAWEQSGAVPLSDLLEARATLYRFQLSRARAWADAVQAEVRLERLLGGPLEGT